MRSVAGMCTYKPQLTPRVPLKRSWLQKEHILDGSLKHLLSLLPNHTGNQKTNTCRPYKDQKWVDNAATVQWQYSHCEILTKNREVQLFLRSSSTATFPWAAAVHSTHHSVMRAMVTPAGTLMWVCARSRHRACWQLDSPTYTYTYTLHVKLIASGRCSQIWHLLHGYLLKKAIIWHKIIVLPDLFLQM